MRASASSGPVAGAASTWSRRCTRAVLMPVKSRVWVWMRARSAGSFQTSFNVAASAASSMSTRVDAFELSRQIRQRQIEGTARAQHQHVPAPRQLLDRIQDERAVALRVGPPAFAVVALGFFDPDRGLAELQLGEGRRIDLRIELPAQLRGRRGVHQPRRDVHRGQRGQAIGDGAAGAVTHLGQLVHRLPEGDQPIEQLGPPGAAARQHRLQRARILGRDGRGFARSPPRRCTSQSRVGPAATTLRPARP